MSNEVKNAYPSDASKVLIAFYSYSGNTRECALQIHKQVGGDIFEIETVEPYPSEYSAVTQQVKEELSSGNLPALSHQLDNIDKYDVVFVGSPNWWSTIAPPVRTFLSQFDVSGKRIVPFITHGGGGLARCAQDLAKLCPNSTILKALTISGRNALASRDDILVWLNGLAITE